MPGPLVVTPGIGYVLKSFNNPVNSKINLSSNFPVNYQAKRRFKATAGRTGISLPFVEQD
jgi:hypothetical protein